MAVGFEEGVLAGGVEVGGDHFGAHFLDGDFGDPAEFGFRFGGIAEEGVDFCGAEIAGVDFDDHIAGLEGGRFCGVGDFRDGGDFIDAGAGEFHFDAGFVG